MSLFLCVSLCIYVPMCLVVPVPVTLCFSGEFCFLCLSLCCLSLLPISLSRARYQSVCLSVSPTVSTFSFLRALFTLSVSLFHFLSHISASFLVRSLTILLVSARLPYRIQSRVAGLGIECQVENDHTSNGGALRQQKPRNEDLTVVYGLQHGRCAAVRQRCQGQPVRRHAG